MIPFFVSQLLFLLASLFFFSVIHHRMASQKKGKNTERMIPYILMYSYCSHQSG